MQRAADCAVFLRRRRRARQGCIPALVWALDKPEGRTPQQALDALALILAAGARLRPDGAGRPPARGP